MAMDNSKNYKKKFIKQFQTTVGITRLDDGSFKISSADEFIAIFPIKGIFSYWRGKGGLLKFNNPNCMYCSLPYILYIHTKYIL
jgi:hypothetical protein